MVERGTSGYEAERQRRYARHEGVIALTQGKTLQEVAQEVDCHPLSLTRYLEPYREAFNTVESEHALAIGVAHQEFFVPFELMPDYPKE